MVTHGNGIILWVELRASQAALVVKNLPTNAEDRRDTGSIPGPGRSSGEGNGGPLQYSCLGNLMAREAWWATARGVTEPDMTEHSAAEGSDYSFLCGIRSFVMLGVGWG